MHCKDKAVKQRQTRYLHRYGKNYFLHNLIAQALANLTNLTCGHPCIHGSVLSPPSSACVGFIQLQVAVPSFRFYESVFQLGQTVSLILSADFGSFQKFIYSDKDLWQLDEKI